MSEAMPRLQTTGALLDRRASLRGDAHATDLDAMRAVGILRDVDVHFARTVARLAGESDPDVLLGLAVASRAPGAGHACAELDAPERLVRLEAQRGEVHWPDVDAWRAALAASRVVASPTCDVDALDRPLVLDGTRLYLARYWRYQARLLGALRRRVASVRADVDEATLRASVARLFRGSIGADLQRVAACVAVLRGFAVVTGGPGTGKTTTVLRVLAALVEQSVARGDAPPRILLAAPTGKAAARLGESLVAGLETLDVSPAVRDALPRSASTLHRLLGWQPRTPTRFRHDADHPLPADVVVVDEASMVDLALMAKLVDAVPDDARLVLLGDRDQLASVEAGSILADVCDEAANDFSPAFRARLSALGAPVETTTPETSGSRPPVADAIVRLTRSHRFRDDGGIGALARAIKLGDEAAVIATLETSGSEATFVEAIDEQRALRDVLHRAQQGYRDALGAEGAKQALAALETFRVLTAHRKGASGVAGLNAAIVERLVRDGVLPSEAREGRSFAGQPVLVTENDPSLGLYNGDVGVLLAEQGGELRAWFRTGDGLRALSPARLPAHETVFAMTVHKSQGSEFDEVVLVLPARASAVMTRELLYTAVSRARTRVTIVGRVDVLRAAIRERVQRASGLRDGFWGASDR